MFDQSLKPFHRKNEVTNFITIEQLNLHRFRQKKKHFSIGMPHKVKVRASQHAIYFYLIDANRTFKYYNSSTACELKIIQVLHH